MSEVKRNEITAEGLKALKDRLEYLKTTGRAQISELIATARSFGDLSENAEYDAAKDQQAKMEGEIVELEAAIRTAVVVSDEEITNEKVNVGTTVRVLDQDEDFEDEYRIVGPHEADPMNNAISIDSPVGAALIGKRKGDELTIEIPGGLSHLKVLSIERTERT
ncbi:MAG: transcription elongation factor GreA [Clostridiales bacterium]|nr:transcription elongation factor GreA [Eubacteriales bacterium]MCI5765749.1 transcription elongation factor GreA [Clostridiales bacterium]MDD7122292.1 transcription elongation factor GreA [Clostridiales bacterium]MDY5469179.1 transcription elongation factor GreA [Eubacteriales bacterium]